MTSWQARFFSAAVRMMIRRQSWGRDEQALARRARRLLGSPKPLQWLSMRGLRSTAVREKAVRGEWLEPKQSSENGIIFYIHGGGFVSCSAKTHRPITAALARLTGFRIFSLDYRLAPEHRFPAALDDVETAYKWLLEQRFRR